MRSVIAIPARWASQRFPGKILAEIGDEPMLRRVWRRASEAKGFDGVYVLVDNEDVAEKARSWGAEVIMTTEDCTSGTARIASAVKELDADFVVNVQADECFIEGRLLEELHEHWLEKGGDIVTPVVPVACTEDLLDPNCVKTVLDHEDRALYFSRSPIPFQRQAEPSEWLKHAKYWLHIGVYGYRREVLEKFSDLRPSNLETLECLEQLRFLQEGYSIGVLKTEYEGLAVDTPEDLARALKMLKDREYANQ